MTAKRSVKMSDFIDWETMLDDSKTMRSSGSKIDQLSRMFLHSHMIASDSSGDYQGEDTVVILFTPPIPDTDPKIIIISSYYGSCSGCDSWEDANDKNMKEILESLANNARLFDNFEDTIKYLESVTQAEQYDLYPIKDKLLEQIRKAEGELGGINHKKRSKRAK